MRQKNPLLIVLGVCGGCALIAIIAVVGFGFFGYNKHQSVMFTGIITMEKNMPQFLTDVKSKNWEGAETLVDPTEK